MFWSELHVSAGLPRKSTDKGALIQIAVVFFIRFVPMEQTHSIGFDITVQSLYGLAWEGKRMADSTANRSIATIIVYLTTT